MIDSGDNGKDDINDDGGYNDDDNDGDNDSLMIMAD